MNRTERILIVCSIVFLGFTYGCNGSSSSSLSSIPQCTKSTNALFTFSIIGDYGTDDKTEAAVANLVISWNPDFIITTGDNNYPRGSSATIDDNIGKYYHDFIKPYVGAFGSGSDINRFFPVLGNHDWYTSSAIPYLNYFVLPNNERYYDFTWGNVHFFALDSNKNEPDGVSISSMQAQWLKNSLAASGSTFKIVFMHHPPYSSGFHGNTEYMQWPFGAWGSDAVIAGHEHSYERLDINGTPYFVNGLGGARKYGFTDVLRESRKRYNAKHGAMLVDEESSQIIFRFCSIDNELIDEYVVHK
jgi:tartrate-resistant acid phosphatase type 5